MRGDWRTTFGMVAASAIQFGIVVSVVLWWRGNSIAVSRALRWINDDVFVVLAGIAAVVTVGGFALGWWALSVWITASMGGEDRRHEIRELLPHRKSRPEHATLPPVDLHAPAPRRPRQPFFDPAVVAAVNAPASDADIERRHRELADKLKER